MQPWPITLPQNRKSDEDPPEALKGPNFSAGRLFRDFGIENCVEENAEEVANILIADGRAIYEMLEQEGIREGAESCCGRHFRNRKLAPSRFGEAMKKVASRCANTPLARLQPRVSFGMPYGVELEFKREKHEPAILG